MGARRLRRKRQRLANRVKLLHLAVLDQVQNIQNAHIPASQPDVSRDVLGRPARHVSDPERHPRLQDTSRIIGVLAAHRVTVQQSGKRDTSLRRKDSHRPDADGHLIDVQVRFVAATAEMGEDHVDDDALAAGRPAAHQRRLPGPQAAGQESHQAVERDRQRLYYVAVLKMFEHHVCELAAVAGRRVTRRPSE